MGSKIVYHTNSTIITLFTPIVLNTWYKVSMQWRKTPSPQVRYRYNDEPWTAWITRAQATSVDNPKLMELESYAMDATHEAYFDDVVFNPI